MYHYLYALFLFQAELGELRTEVNYLKKREEAREKKEARKAPPGTTDIDVPRHFGVKLPFDDFNVFREWMSGLKTDKNRFNSFVSITRNDPK
jgi:hypothetical protein